MDTLLSDLRYSLRTLSNRPGFTALVVITLALGIGANATIFSVFNAFLLRPLPVAEPERLVSLSDVQPPDTPTPASFPEFEDWRRNSAIFSGVIARFAEELNLMGKREPMRIRGVLVSRDYFSTLGVQPVAGRAFLPEEHRPGARRVAILSRELWQREFSQSSGVIGSTITLDRNDYTIVGVMPGAPLRFGSQRLPDLWIPLEPDPPYKDRGTHFLTVVARLKPGVSYPQAEANVAILAKQIAQQNHSDHGIRAQPLQRQLFGDERPNLFILLGAAGFLLLIATANVANILMARATARSREFAVRAALGAGRARLLRQTLVESLVLSALGGALGLAVGAWASELLRLAWPAYLPKPESFQPDWRVLLFLLVVACGAGVLFGLVPALQLSLSTLNESLRDGWTQIGEKAARSRMRGALVVGEIAVALVLLAGSALLLKSFRNVLAVDPGFRPEQVLTMSVALPPAKYKEPPRRVAFFDDALRRIGALPATRAAGAILNLPLGDGGMNGDVRIEGRTFQSGHEPVAEKHVVTPGYFHAIGTPLVRGRLFSEQDNQHSSLVVIVNEALARRMWPNQNPIGKRIDVGVTSREGWQEIVGVVRDVKLDGLDRPSSLETYVPYAQSPASEMTFVVRTAGEPEEVASAVRASILAIDPEQPVFDIQSMHKVVSESLAGRRLSTLMIGVFAVLAMLLAGIGIYGVVSYWVTERTREIGIRTALGAQRIDILRLVLGRGMLLTLIGLGLGVCGSLALTRFLALLLFGVGAQDATLLTAVSVLLAAVALAACLIPARRASRVDPMVSLRAS